MSDEATTPNAEIGPLAAEVLERQSEGVGRILPPPDPATLDVTARVGYSETSMTERVRKLRQGMEAR